MKGSAPIFDGVVNAQHELDQTAQHINDWPSEMVAEKIGNTIMLLTALQTAVEKRTVVEG